MCSFMEGKQVQQNDTTWRNLAWHTVLRCAYRISTWSMNANDQSPYILKRLLTTQQDATRDSDTRRWDKWNVVTNESWEITIRLNIEIPMTYGKNQRHKCNPKTERNQWNDSVKDANACSEWLLFFSIEPPISSLVENNISQGVWI